MKWGHQGTTAVVRLVLMSLLAVEDFGVVGMAWLYLMFIDIILDQGFGAAIIQRKNLEQRHMESVFWLVVLASIALCGISILLSGWWASVNNEPRLTDVIAAMSIIIPIQGLTTVQVALLNRSMDFRSLAIRNFLSAVLGGAIGIGLALYGFGVWALVAQQLTAAVAALALLWVLSDWRPRFRFSWTATRELLGFSTGNFIAKLGVFAGNWADQILIGIFFGAFAVGIYRSAAGLMSMLVELGTRAISSVSFPQFARSQDDPEQLRRDIGFCLWLSSTIMIPSLAVLAGVSGALMAVLGDRWLDAANVLKVLCVVGAAQSLVNFVTPVLQGVGRAQFLFVFVWTAAIVSNVVYVAVGLLAEGQPEAMQPLFVAGARAALFVGIFLPATFLIIRSICGFSLTEFVRSLGSGLQAGLVAFFAIQGLITSELLVDFVPLVQLLAEGVVGTFAAGTVLLVVDSSLRLQLRRILGQSAT